MKKVQRKSFGFVAGLMVIGMGGVASASVLGTVGTKDFTADDVRNEYTGMTPQQRDVVNGDSNSRRSLVENFVNSELLLQAAVKAGYDHDAEFNKAMDRYRKQLLASRMMEKVVEPKLTKAAIKQYFESNKFLFDSTQVCAEHILVPTEAEAGKVLKEVTAKGADFGAIAKKKSIDPGVQENKGNLGCFTRDQMVPEFSFTAFNMKKNEIKGPVHTMYGFHVIHVLAVKPGKVPGFEEVEEQAKQSFRVKLVQEMVQDLRAKSNVKVNEAEVGKFKL